MSDINIYNVDKTFDKWDQIELLFREFYTGMEDNGLIIKLVPGGEKMWVNSIKKRIGLLAVLVVAEDEGEIIGFCSGYLKITPDFLGGSKVGFADSLFVFEKYRNHGLAEKLFDHLEQWYISKEVYTLECQVLVDNFPSISFLEKRGYKKELFQMRKFL